MTQYKTMQVIILPTRDKTSRLVIDDNSRRFNLCDPNEALWGHQHVYIVSDAEIKTNDWYLWKLIGENDLQWRLGKCTDGKFPKTTRVKVEASTDINLVANYDIKPINKSFLEELVATNGNIKEIDVEVITNTKSDIADGGKDFFIKTRTDNTIITHINKTSLEEKIESLIKEYKSNIKILSGEIKEIANSLEGEEAAQNLLVKVSTYNTVVTHLEQILKDEKQS